MKKSFAVLTLLATLLFTYHAVIPEVQAASTDRCPRGNCTRPSRPSRPSTPSRPTTRPSRPSRPSTPNRPTTRPSRPSRPTTPTTRPSRPSRPTTPVTRPSRPNRPTTPVTRPSRPNRPTNPVTRPSRPNRPTTPVTRPTRPTRPTAPTTRPNRPTRPTNPTTRPNRPTRPGPVTRPNRPNRPSRPVVRNPTRRVINPGRVGGRRPGVVRNRHRVDTSRMTMTNRRHLRRNHAYHRGYMHRPGWHAPLRYYSRHHHSPWLSIGSHHNRWHSSMRYHYTVPYRHLYWNSWVRWSVSWDNGYRYDNGYPYYAYNGYRHRYSSLDRCDYELVDGRYNTTYKTFYTYFCSTGYDRCSELRDNMNHNAGEYRYFCSEKFKRDKKYNYNYNYTEHFYSDLDEISTDEFDVAEYDDFVTEDYDDWGQDFDDWDDQDWD
jgi:hypothetical protein